MAGFVEESFGEGALTKEDILREEIREAILKNLGNPKLQLIDFEAKSATTAGDNYGSTMYSVKLHMKDSGTGENETISIMLKLLPRNEFRVQMMNESMIFVKEVNFYREVAPALEKFQRDLGIPEENIVSYWPKCFAGKTDGKGDYIAMEDLKVKGYRMADRKGGLDFEHCKLFLEAQARYHAVSYAMFGGDFNKIVERFQWLPESMYNEERTSPQMREVISSAFQHISDKLKMAGEDEAAENTMKLHTNNFFPIMCKLLCDKTKWAVIGHGDCWTNNLMFKYDEQTGKPISVKFLDFQVCRVGSRALDIHYFLHSSPQKPVLNERGEELQQIYFNEFTRFAQQLGVDINAHELTRENFDVEIDHFRFFGCVTGILIAMVTSAESADIPEIESMTLEEMTTTDPDQMALLKLINDVAIKKMTNIACVHLPKCPQVNGAD